MQTITFKQSFAVVIALVFVFASGCTTQPEKKLDEFDLPDAIYEPAFNAAQAKRKKQEERQKLIDSRVTPTKGRTEADLNYVFELYKQELDHYLNLLFANYPKLEGEIFLTVAINPEGQVMECTIDNLLLTYEFEYHPRLCALLKRLYFGRENDLTPLVEKRIHFKQTDSK